ncbi:MAG TPA: membrane protein insertase YidC [Gemmatimonadaceae bacterium]
MDKRLLIALLLTAIVVAVTPVLFPTKRAPVPAAAQKDSVTTAPPAASTSNANQQQPSAALETRALTPVADSADTVASTPTAVSPEITSVNTPRSIYRFTNFGAAPVSVSMRDYKNLSHNDGPVEISTTGRSLLHYSLVLRGDTIPLDRIPFQLQQSQGTNGQTLLTYRAAVNGANVAIAYDIDPSRYILKTSGRVENTQGTAFLLIDMPSNMPITEADSVSDLRTRSYSYKPARSNARGVPFAKLDSAETKLEAEPITWAAVRNKYFVVGVISPAGATFDEMTITGAPRVGKIARDASATVVKAVKNGTFAFDIYVGPQQQTQLLSVGRDFDHVNPYGWSFLQPVVNPIAALCIKLLLWLHDTLKVSYGWVLILFGVLIRLLLWPLNQTAMRSQLKMQELQPRLAEIQKKYKDNPDKQRQEMMRVYSEAGTSPFAALSGCLPMLLPMPVLFALFFVFQNTIEFRGVPFLWLTDISIKDPYYILPLLMGISMYLLSWIGLRNAPPNPQAKMMSYMFPVMMTFFLASMASGLNLYYTAQNIAALPQQWILAKERQKARRT